MDFPPGWCYQDKLWSLMSETDQVDFLNTSTQVSAVSNLQARESEPKIPSWGIHEWAELHETLPLLTATLNMDKCILWCGTAEHEPVERQELRQVSWSVGEILYQQHCCPCGLQALQELSYILEGSIWCVELDRLEGSPRVKNWELPGCFQWVSASQGR